MSFLKAILHEGTIYLSAIETEESKLEKQNRTARQQEMCYWGYKFEQYCTKSIHQQEQPGDTVNSNPEYVSGMYVYSVKHIVSICNL